VWINRGEEKSEDEENWIGDGVASGMVRVTGAPLSRIVKYLKARMIDDEAKIDVMLEIESDSIMAVKH
jgi:hypothetical protein